jgi:hypothetical protein
MLRPAPALTDGRLATVPDRCLAISLLQRCTLLVAVTRPARFADHFLAKNDPNGLVLRSSPSRPARFARTSPPPRVGAGFFIRFELEVSSRRSVLARG